MIFGNPYKFAIWIEEIDEWSSENFSEGIFTFFVNGDMIPQELPNTSTFLPNSLRSIQQFISIIDNLECPNLFDLDYCNAYIFLNDAVHYRNMKLSEEESYSYWKYCITEYIDNHEEKDNIWYLSNKHNEKLLYLNNNIIKESVFKKGYIKNIMEKIIMKYNYILNGNDKIYLT
ncbi:TPA: immunity 42 family protein [Neisseria meningitidis]|uniref:immunity 42 family protein n=1 Tax=Neisseria meningitidis TaxID=487 RepID=UPI000E571B6D|nr:immunity 42 family protein [Neisseria meningitidis]